MSFNRFGAVEADDDAADIIWTLTSPAVHRLLRVDRNWSAKHYAEWLSETLIRTLLP